MGKVIRKRYTTEFKAKGGFRGDQGRVDAGRAGRQAWRSPDDDRGLEDAGYRRNGGKFFGQAGSRRGL